MPKRSIKKLTLARLIQIFLLAIVTIVMIMFLSYQHFFNKTVENKAYEIASAVKAGLTSHMKAGIMDKRGYFLKEIASIDNISSIQILRSKSINKQFGISSFKSDSQKQIPQEILNTKKAYFDWDSKEGSVIATLPYIASSQANLNCLNCHKTTDGAVLGAIEIEMDIKPFQNLITQYSYIIILLLVFFALIIILNMFNFVERYISKPLTDIISDGRDAYEHHNDIDAANYEIEELEVLAENINDFNHNVLNKEKQLQTKNRELQELNLEIESTLQETIIAMGEIEEIRSEDTRYHTKRVAKLSAMIAKEYGLDAKTVKLLEMTAPLHDIGKVGIGDAILLKPDKLTHQEYEIMKTHAELGYRVLKHSKREVLKTAATIAHTHHERYDGEGYPRGIKGKSIPILGRIVAIVDVLDALACTRIYKDAWEIEDIRTFMQEARGTHFDPHLTDIVLQNLEEYVTFIHKLS